MANKNSRTEAKFREEAMKRGWAIFSKGYPDYVIKKDNEVIFVECKKKQLRNTKKMGFSKHQLQMKAVLESLGLKYKVYRGDWGDIEDGYKSK